ncbi:MAG: peptidyl-prolyl cis-trans isomerase [Bdellovibrionales bacterium]|nr:peptidyl-prolyl cis-trans isomerase [Bdellovibrionales bacterium]
MKYLLGVSLSLFLASVSCLKHEQQEALVLIDDMKITVKDLTDRMKEYDFDPSSMPKDQSLEFKEKVLNEMIEEKILLREASNRNLDIQNAELEIYMEQMKGDYTDEDFDKILESRGMSMKDLKLRTKMNLLLGRVVDSLTRDVTKPSKDKIESYYKENIEEFFEPKKYLVQQIVVRSQEDAKHVLNLIKKKESFDDLARAYSLTPEGSKGGRLGWLYEGLPKVVWKSVASAKLNVPVGPIESEYGFHIVKVLDIKPERLLPQSEAKPKIESELTRRERDELLTKWKQETFSKIKIVRNNALLASI